MQGSDRDKYVAVIQPGKLHLKRQLLLRLTAAWLAEWVNISGGRLQQARRSTWLFTEPTTRVV